MGPKQREAQREQQRFRITNQGGPGASADGGEPMSPTDTNRSGPVTVHEDAGMAEEEEDESKLALGAEIPPT